MGVATLVPACVVGPHDVQCGIGDVALRCVIGPLLDGLGHSTSTRLALPLALGFCLGTTFLRFTGKAYIYAEQGLSRQRVSVWIYEGQLRIEYRETLVARYRCAYDQRQKRLREVSHPTLYTTVFASPQLELIELDDAQWIKVQQRVWHRRTPRMTSIGEQLPLAGLGTSALVFFYIQAL